MVSQIKKTSRALSLSSQQGVESDMSTQTSLVKPQASSGLGNGVTLDTKSDVHGKASLVKPSTAKENESYKALLSSKPGALVRAGRVASNASSTSHLTEASNGFVKPLVTSTDARLPSQGAANKGVGNLKIFKDKSITSADDSESEDRASEDTLPATEQEMAQTASSTKTLSPDREDRSTWASRFDVDVKYLESVEEVRLEGKESIEEESVSGGVEAPTNMALVTFRSKDVGAHGSLQSDSEDEDFINAAYTTDQASGVHPDDSIQAEIGVAKPIGISQIDFDIGDDLEDITMAAEYSDDIFQYLKDLEVELLPVAHYMDVQTEIQWSMRAVLVDWVVQVHSRFHLLPETLFLAVNYIDRFLSHKVVSLGKLQLVGATALYLAAKYEEVNCPQLREMVYMVDGGYTIQELLKAERFMLSILQYELGWPGPMSFLRRISKADNYDLASRTLSKYLLEVMIMDEGFVATPPSFSAAAAHCLSRLLLRKGGWTAAHTHLSGYCFPQIEPLLPKILQCCHRARTHHTAVFDKYLNPRFEGVSAFVQTELMQDFSLPSEMCIRSISYDAQQEVSNTETSDTAPASQMPIPILG